MGRPRDLERFYGVLEHKKMIDSGEISIYRVAKRLRCSAAVIYKDLERINKELW